MASPGRPLMRELRKEESVETVRMKLDNEETINM